MSDLVKRLRFNSTAGVPDFTNSKLLEEAADRIEELEDVCKRDRFADGYGAGLQDYKTIADKRIAELEKALKVYTRATGEQQPNDAVFKGFRGNNEA